MAKPTLFVTNDDGVDAPGIQQLIRELNIQGFPVVAKLIAIEGIPYNALSLAAETVPECMISIERFGP